MCNPDLGKKFTKVALLLLAISTLATADDKRQAGEIRDPQAFAKVQSFCVDTAGLSDFDRRIVKDFLKAESKPKHLLTKLPWKLVPECQGGDSAASVRVEFAPIRVIRIVLPQGAPDQEPETPYAIKAVLDVVSADSQGPIYSVWSRAVMNGVGPANSSAGSSTSESVNPVMEKRDALYHAFWCLVDDLRQLKPTPTE